MLGIFCCILKFLKSYIYGWSTTKSTSMGTLNSKELKNAFTLVTEFIQDEIKYVQALDLVEDIFIRPLSLPQKKKQFCIQLDPTFTYSLFANWSSLRNLHHDFINKVIVSCTVHGNTNNKHCADFALQSKQKFILKNNAHKILPKVLQELVPYLRLYSEYLKATNGFNMKQEKVRFSCTYNKKYI